MNVSSFICWDSINFIWDSINFIIFCIIKKEKIIYKISGKVIYVTLFSIVNRVNNLQKNRYSNSNDSIFFNEGVIEPSDFRTESNKGGQKKTVYKGYKKTV